MAAETGSTVWSDWAIPPGDFLADTLEALSMSQAELAARTGRPAQAINEIVRGRKAITADTALEFERVLGVPAHIWLGLENEHQLTLARLREREALNEEVSLAGEFPVKEMERRGWLQRSPVRDSAARVGALQHFFGVATLRAVLDGRTVPAGALRVSEKAKVKKGSLLAWLRQGEIEAAAIDTASFDKKAFEEAIHQIRTLSREHPEVFVPEMRRLCSDAGVALVLVPELPGTGANGCTRWLSRSKAVIQLNLRNRWADVFWFTFFHEAGHVLQRRFGQVIVDLTDRVGDGDEADADRFAADLLIPPDRWEEFATTASPSESAVRDFADQLKIHPGIVVGRAQRELWGRYDVLNSLRVRYEWENSAKLTA